MSDVYIPGIKSRFNTEKVIEDLMKVERIPKDRVEKNVENLQAQKTYWQDLGRRIGDLRDSARFLYSFQNPFNDRVVNSSDSLVLSGTSTREAVNQERYFIVKQIAQADRFLSDPLEDSFKVEEGTYTFSVGQDVISFNFRGGSLREFAEALNRRGRDKLGASLISVQPGKKSLFIESRITGDGNRLVFSSKEAENLGLRTGLLVESDSSVFITPRDEVIKTEAGKTASIPLDAEAVSADGAVLQFEVATELRPVETEQVSLAEDTEEDVSEEGEEHNAKTSSMSIASRTPAEPPKSVNNMRVLYVTFSDGTNSALPLIKDSTDFTVYKHQLSDISKGKTIVSLEVTNQNTHRDVSIRNVQIADPNVVGGFKPQNPISAAQDVVVTMEGIEIRRPTNTVADLIPGVTLTAKMPSDKPVRIGIEPDQEAIKNSIISFVGNYNRLMADINVLTRNDERVIQELSYLSEEEQADLRKRMGAFSGDSILSQFRNSLQRVAIAPYPTSAEQDLTMLPQIGIGTDVRGSGISGYDPSRLRGYLEINEKVLDAALDTKLSAIQQLFGYDTDGDLIVDTGVAYMLETISRPYTEIGGIIALKTATIDSRLNQEQRRIESLDRQLAAKEAALKNQYGQMEGAFNRMERMTTSLDQFSQQNSNR